MKVQVRNQGEQVPGMSAPMCPSTSVCARVTHRAPDNLLLGRRPRIRKDKPEGNGAASRTKGGSRARCARGSGSQLSSPVRAEHVVSFTKPLQRLVCRGLGLPRVGLQAGSVCRGRGEKYHDAISNCPHPENCRWAYNRGMGKQNFLFPHVHSKTSSSFSPAMGRFAYEQHNDKDKHFLLTRRRSPVLFLR